MEETVSNFVSVAVSIVVVAVFMICYIPFSVLMFSGDFGGFNTQIEKTAEKTDGVLATTSTTTTPADVLLMVAISDKYEPSPKTLNINGTTIDLQDMTYTDSTGSKVSVTLEDSRNQKVSQAYTALDWSKTKGTLITAVGPNGQRDWRYIYG